MNNDDRRKQIDIRIMKLNKWYVPKSVDLHDCKEPVILGYFDELQVKELNVDNISEKLQHPFKAGYGELIAWKRRDKTEIVDRSSQEQILFLNISEDSKEDGISFTKKTVQDFWDKEKDSCPYLFLSMIHISHSGKIVKALTKIKEVFQSNYLSYISYDYCDIVLFAKNIQIPDFMNKIKQLFKVSDDGEKVIFDTFSMVSFYPEYNLNQISEEHNGAGTPHDAVDSQFQATINLSIRDHKAFNKWYKHYQEEIKEKGYKVECYDLFGRHDISITNEDADTEWLIDIMEKLHNEENQKKFWTFETFIKIKKEDTTDVDSDTTDIDSDTADDLEKNHNKVKDRLQDEVDKLKAVIDKSPILDKDRYILPVYEVMDCICSIVKNSFAEEFVCCIYESFLHFVSYMTVEIGKINEGLEDCASHENKIAKSYNKYFVALNTLVNSTMHNERQFVQATAFNAVFYSVPPKIMAFYNAYIYRMKQILKDENSKEYTFLIYPSFSPIMSVKQISLAAAPPCDRILTVTISERSLYDIESVLYQMVHELAHYVGRNSRCRVTRHKKIMPALLRWIMDECRMEGEIYQIFQKLVIDERTDRAAETRADGTLYLESLPSVGKDFIRTLGSPENVYHFFYEYYQDCLDKNEEFDDQFLDECGIEKEYQKSYIENYAKQYASVKCNEFCKQLMKMNEFGRADRYKSYIETIKYIYRECYADLQMVLVLGMNAQDYLSTFLVNLEVPVRELLQEPKDIVRISAVFRTMIDCGLWKAPKEQDNSSFGKVFAFINNYNKNVEEHTEKDRIIASGQKAVNIKNKKSKFDFEDGIRLKEKLTNEIATSIENQDLENVPLTSIASGLYEYLLEVMEVSLEEYSSADKALKIQQARKLVNKILDFKDAIEVFNCVEEEISYYKCEGCKI